VNIIPLHKKQLKKPSRKLLSHFSPSYSQQSFGMLCVFPISLHINMVFYKIVPVLHNCSLCFILYDKNLIRMNRLTWYQDLDFRNVFYSIDHSILLQNSNSVV
jgi:hypothetical protein